MKSYASVQGVEGKFAVCEVELISVEESKPEDFSTKDCEMMDFSLKELSADIGEVMAGDILVVEHDGKNVIWVYSKDNEEKNRRLLVLNSIMGR